MALSDYIYIDKKRLESYFEQIAASTVVYDKVPTWKVGFGVTKLGVEATQTHVSRLPTEHEKLLRLIDYLVSEKMIGGNNDFQLVTLDATRIHIPAREDYEFNGLSLWYAVNKFKQSLAEISVDEIPEKENKYFQVKSELFLLEDFPLDDRRASSNLNSSYSSLWMLLESLTELSADVQKTKIMDSFTNEKGNTQDSKHWGYIKECIYRSNNGLDAFNYLISLGSRVTFQRRIRTLYRVRQEEVGICDDVGLFGYPIFIADARKDELSHDKWWRGTP